MGQQVSNIIKNNRKKKGLSQDYLAEKLNITTSYLSLIENSRREPSLKLRKKISSILDIPLSTLVLSDIKALASNKQEKEIEKLISKLYEKIQGKN